MVALIVQGALLLNGSILDTGAFTGEEACYYADLDRSRKVHALEPIYANFKTIQRYVPGRPNLVPMHGALGSASKSFLLKSAKVGHSSRSHTSMLQDTQLQAGVEDVKANRTEKDEFKSTIHVHRLDDLFEHMWHEEKLAFAHIDVEGAELDVLHGAESTIQRDRPLFSVEVWVHKNHTYTRSLIDTVGAYGYRPYAIAEKCGLNLDCRNLLCVPTERHSAFVAHLTSHDMMQWLSASTAESLIKTVPAG